MPEIKETLLGLTQQILSDINGEEVNSIDDTDEALQVARIIVDVFFQIMTDRDVPEHRELGKLEALADNTKPTYLRLPEGAFEICGGEFYYDKADLGESLEYGPVYWVEFWEFLKRSRSLDPDATTTTTMTDFNGGTTLYISNDQHPTWFTSFDDKHIVCNSYDATIDNTLQSSKTQALFRKAPTISFTDTATIDIDPEYFVHLRNEARARAFAWVKTEVDQKAEQAAQRSKNRLQIDSLRVGNFNRKRDYGRT